MPTVLEPIQMLPGVEPVQDRPESTTQHYVFSKRIRFIDGFPEKIGGWQSLTFNENETIGGVPRTIFSYILAGLERYLVGTNTRLNDIFGTVLTNITPVKTATIAIANSLDTFYATLGNDPIDTVSASTTLTINDTAHKFVAGDTATLSGSAAVNGVPAVEINAPQVVRSTTTNTFTIIVDTPATSTGSGGGAAVVRSSGIITVNSAAHDMGNGDRVKILAAVAVGGITALEINLEFIIRNVTTNQFDIVTAGTATSSVTGGGGAATTYQEPMAAGNADTLLGNGYGLGLYGVGLYGVSKTSLTPIAARVWSHDRFGNLTLSCAGQQTDIYQWDANTAVAPVKVTNSPLANYVFVSNEITVAVGYDTASATPLDNAISWTDQGGLTNWTTGQSGSDIIEGAGEFLSHVSTRGENLLFTRNQTYIFRYIGGQFIWQTQLLDGAIGLIAQNARVAASGIAFWMGTNNFYMWRGGNVEVIPSNSSTEATCLRYVFDDINFGQKEKFHAWFNPEFREVWFHYASASSNECDRIARVNIDTFVWVIDEIDRSAAEYPSIINQTPYLAKDDGVIYLHENGLNDDGNGMSWQVTTRQIYGGTDTVQIAAFIPDQTMTGNIVTNLTTRNYPSSADTVSINYTVTATTERVATEINGRYWQFDITGNDVDQDMQFGQWFHEIKRSSAK